MIFESFLSLLDVVVMPFVQFFIPELIEMIGLAYKMYLMQSHYNHDSQLLANLMQTTLYGLRNSDIQRAQRVIKQNQPTL